MKRYNQGFGSFGPMEQCKYGEWVKYHDHKNTVDGLRRVFEAFDKHLEDNYKVKLSNQKYKAELWRFIAAISVSINAVFIILEIIKRFLL